MILQLWALLVKHLHDGESWLTTTHVSAKEINLLRKDHPKIHLIRNDETRNDLHIPNFIEKCSFWKGESGSSSQESPSLLWISGVHYRVHKIPPLVIILKNINTVPTLPLISLVYVNIIP
jgi:hypothetical protein